MKLIDKRGGALVVLSVLLGAAALVMGAGSAGADTCGTTNGTLGDATVYVPGVVAADLDSNTSRPGFYLCVVPPGQGLGVGVADASTGAVGYQVDFLACGSLTPGCRGFEDTGAEVEPDVDTNTPLNGTTAGSGATAGSGPSTCTYVNGVATCPLGGVTVAGVTVNEADLVPQVTPVTPTPPCTGVNNTCVPAGGTVRIFQDRTAPTGSVTTGVTGGTNTVDAYSTLNCVQVNASC
jgi:hypothetical protein